MMMDTSISQLIPTLLTLEMMLLINILRLTLKTILITGYGSIMLMIKQKDKPLLMLDLLIEKLSNTRLQLVTLFLNTMDLNSLMLLLDKTDTMET